MAGCGEAAQMRPSRRESKLQEGYSRVTATANMVILRVGSEATKSQILTLVCSQTWRDANQTESVWIWG